MAAQFDLGDFSVKVTATMLFRRVLVSESFYYHNKICRICT